MKSLGGWVVLVTFFMGGVVRAQRPHWSAGWGASQQKSTETESLAAKALEGGTVRQVVRLSAGGDTFRLRFSNAFGQTPLVLRDVRVGRPHGEPGEVDPGTQISVRFNGSGGVSIPPGAEYLSDSIALTAQAFSDLAITFVVEKAPQVLTFHGGSRATSFLLPGDHVSDAKFVGAQHFEHWYFLAGVDVGSGAKAFSIVALGDSITDGHGATVDGNDRWTDVLAQRLSGKGIGVVNEGIGGNHLLTDGLGVNALARFDRDVLGVAGVRDLVVLEGVNDLGGLDRTEEHPQADHDALVERLEGALLQLAERAHTHGIRVLVGTVTPDGGSGYYHPQARDEADRQRLNSWIKSTSAFDGVIDFDAVLRDPQHPERLAAEYDSGDHLHPSVAGYRKMGDSVPLSLFK